MRKTIWNSGRKWMLGTTLAAGLFGAGLLGPSATAANAAPLQFRVGVGEGYVPPCPGEGYVWADGYYNGGYWVPGAWRFRGREEVVRTYDRGYGRDARYYSDRRGNERRFENTRGDRDYRDGRDRDVRDRDSRGRR